MRCYQGQNRSYCCRCCGNSSDAGNGGIIILPSFPELPVSPGGGTTANICRPVHIFFPAFLWDTVDGGGEDPSYGCGYCRG